MSSKFISLNDGSINLYETSTSEQDDESCYIDKCVEEEDSNGTNRANEENKTEQTKEPDMNVFLETNNSSLQKTIIENEHLQKMQQVINNSTLRSTSNFADKLENQFQSVFLKTEDHSEEESSEETTIMSNKSSVVTELRIEDVSKEVLREELNLNVANTCSLTNLQGSDNENNFKDLESKNETEKFPVDTKQKNVLDTKLESLASNSENNLGNNFQENVNLEEGDGNCNMEKVINAGVIEVLIRENEQKYSCLIPGCNFTTLYKLSFTKHCLEFHRKLTVFCQICNKTELEQTLFTMSSLFVHLFDRHKENFKINVITPVSEKDSTAAGKIRLRRISGDILSRPVSTEPVEQMGVIQIKNVRTLTQEEENILEPEFQPEVKKSLSTKKVRIVVSNNSVIKNSAGKTAASEGKNLEVGLSKAKKIFKEMLRFPKILDLYKCPLELCSFSTNNKSEFLSHFAIHRWCQITKCVYCEQAISSDNILTHIDKFHAQCLYQCAFCFYRSIWRQYLILHLDLTHKHESDLTKIYALPMKKDTVLNNFLDKAAPRKNTILPYKCAQENCAKSFLLPDNFLVHLNVHHNKYFVCSYCVNTKALFVKSFHLIQHYVLHSVAKYQCRFCRYGVMTMKDMLIHYMKLHPANKPICYIRKFKYQMDAQSIESLKDIMEINMDLKNLENISDLPSVSSPSSHSSLTESQENLSPKLDKILASEKSIYSEESEMSVTESLSDSNIETQSKELLNESSDRLNSRNVESDENIDSTKSLLELSGIELYKCGTPDCSFQSEYSSCFEKHLLSCDVLTKNNGDYQCFHCKENFTTVFNLCEHIKEHRINRFKCSECDFKSASNQSIIRHMKISHNTSTIYFVPVDREKNNMNTDKFTATPSTVNIKTKLGPSSPESVPDKLDITENTFELEDSNPLLCPSKIGRNVFKFEEKTYPDKSSKKRIRPSKVRKRNLKSKAARKRHQEMKAYISEISPPNSISTEKYDSLDNITGYRIVEIEYYTQRILDIQCQHNVACTFGKLSPVAEDRCGLGFVTKIILRCSHCSQEYLVQTENPDKTVSFVNTAAVWGTLAVGNTYSHMEDIYNTMDIPLMPRHVFNKIEKKLGNAWKDNLWEIMKEAGEEERKIALEKGDVTQDNVPKITVYLDGCWNRRIYGRNNAASGIGAIIGRETGKLLWVGVKNQFCTICSRAANRKETVPIHTCFRIWSNSTPSIETDIIVEGFCRSEEMHGVRYLTFVVDEDSTMYAQIKQRVPYGKDVEKIECINQVVENYGKKLFSIKNDESISSAGKNLFTNDIIKSIQNAMQYSIYINALNDNEILKKSIKISPNHILDDHSQCNIVYCENAGKIISNKVKEFKEAGIFQSIKSALEMVIKESDTLVDKQTSKRAETFRNILARFNTNKRINFPQKISFETSNDLAVKGRYNSWKEMGGQSPKDRLTKFLQNCEKYKYNQRRTVAGEDLKRKASVLSDED